MNEYERIKNKGENHMTNVYADSLSAAGIGELEDHLISTVVKRQPPF